MTKLSGADQVFNDPFMACSLCFFSKRASLEILEMSILLKTEAILHAGH